MLTYLLPLHHTEMRDVEVTANYEDFKIASGLITLDEAKQLVADLVKNNELCLPKQPKVALKVFLYPDSSKSFCDSGDRRFPVFYSFYEFRFSVANEFKAHPPQRALLSLDSPLYPSAKEALEDLIFARLGSIYSEMGEFIVLAPDYRARIREIRLSTKGVEVSVECPMGSSEGDLVGKLYYETLHGNVLHGELQFEKGNASFSANDFARHLWFALLSRSKGDLIDRRVFSLGSPYLPPGIKLAVQHIAMQCFVVEFSHPPQRALLSLDSPLYPSAKEALEDLIFARLGSIYSEMGEFIVLAPDYRARIREIRLSTKGVEVSVECPMGSSEGDLVGKLYYETLHGNVLHGELQFEKGNASFSANDFARHLWFALLSRSKGDLIDRRVFSLGSPYLPPGIKLESPEQDLEHVTLAGESDTLEFKRELPQKREDIAVVAVSFANSRGGRILVGIDDNGQVVGCNLEKPEEQLASILRHYCEPPLSFGVTETMLREKRVQARIS